ncbi:MAG: hypothetical protein UY85_C0070G0009 [Candidatus Peribacteria bacterium GW2011_GWB1_54_5]|nr:MAG: hypothetical protein UY85_C0070G0009 [Candidatus Peribacteria bacterium GW2011_GWB1_54_5]
MTIVRIKPCAEVVSLCSLRGIERRELDNELGGIEMAPEDRRVDGILLHDDEIEGDLPVSWCKEPLSERCNVCKAHLADRDELITLLLVRRVHGELTIAF